MAGMKSSTISNVSQKIPTCKRFNNLTGGVFGRLKVVSYAGREKNRTFWNCVCECGITKIIDTSSLIRGFTRSCGCYLAEHRHLRLIDLTGKRYGYFTVLHFIEIKNKRTYWSCICDCGNIITVDAGHLRNGLKVSCGCKNYENLITHGLHGTPTYITYHAMIQRCCNENNPNYDRYGGRGICVCDRWLESFESFVLDMGIRPDGLEIDRIDNNKGYSKDNCRWTSKKTNNRNRNSCNMIFYNGETKSLTEWCEVLHLPRKQISARVNRLKWSISRAFEQPIKKNK